MSFAVTAWFSISRRGVGLLLLLCAALPVVQARAGAEEPVAAQVWQAGGDPVARLWQRLAAGEATLDTTTETAFLRDLLRALEIPAESQVLVFSKTSLQKGGISPETPRALYYNEQTYLGWVRGGDLEVVTAAAGGEFQYYLVRRLPGAGDAEAAAAAGKGRPLLLKSGQCLSCHVGGDLQIQSVYTRANGYPMGQEDRFVTTSESPLAERWGGWYVTGRHGAELHMGNVTVRPGPASGGAVLDRRRGANVLSLEGWLSLEAYPVKTSDIVALMVLEHQYVLHNALQESGRAVRRVQARMQAEGGGQELLDRALQKRAQALAELLLFTGEQPLPEGGIQGAAAFQEAFRHNRKEAAGGLSLKDFDLRTRLFRQRCSYMIHAPAFKGLPEALRLAVYDRLGQALEAEGGDGPEAENASAFPKAERRAIRQILMETESEIRKRWQHPAGQPPASP